MKAGIESRSTKVWWVCLVGIGLVALTALRSLPQISELLFTADGDDQMRLVQVRDWLAGQGWFDLRQYRVLPPEGISMHWSRYVDAGIAAVLTAAGWVLPASQAELATVILWPSLLACLMVLVHAHGTQRLMGTAAAFGALAVFLSWGKLGGEFVPPRIDHHNVQILCATAIFYLSLVPGRSRVLGAFAGLVLALSLAVGLEMLPFLATIWGLVALRHVFGEARAGDWLLGHAASFAIAAPLLMIGQTAPADWMNSHCDVLAPPVMALGAVGIVATVAQVLAGRVLTGALPRLLVLAGLTALGLWLVWPVLGHCLAGPYAGVAPEVLDIIQNNVAEALSARTLIDRNPDLLGRVLLPPLLLALLALVTAWRLRHRLDPAQKTALVQAFVVVLMGTLFAAIQIRAANLMTPAVPLLAGFLVHAFTLIPRTSPARLPAAVILILAMPAVVERAVTATLTPAAGTVVASAPSGGQSAASDCRTATAMAEIASLPPSLLFSTLNLGPTIVAYTPQSVTSAGYHRNPEAFWNGVGAFQTLDKLHQAIRTSGADYLVLCPGGRLERTSPVMQALLDGALPPWLSDATEGRQEVRVFRVDPAELAKAAP